MTRKERFKGIIRYFSEHQPQAETELEYESPFQLLVSVILSAQCTDKRVNMTTPEFFRQFPDAETLSKASAEEVFPHIKSISYPNNKTKHLIGMAKMLVNEFNSEVPADLNELQKLPGVGRKTANVVLGNAFGIRATCHLSTPSVPEKVPHPTEIMLRTEGIRRTDRRNRGPGPSFLMRSGTQRRWPTFHP